MRWNVVQPATKPKQPMPKWTIKSQAQPNLNEPSLKEIEFDGLSSYVIEHRFVLGLGSVNCWTDTNDLFLSQIRANLRGFKLYDALQPSAKYQITIQIYANCNNWYSKKYGKSGELPLKVHGTSKTLRNAKNTQSQTL